MKKFIVFSVFFAVLFLGAGGTYASSNPSGTGQPGAECGEAGSEMMPNGFNSDGFANAETHYAGSDNTASVTHSNSTHAVSQYDIACYQVTQNHK